MDYRGVEKRGKERLNILIVKLSAIGDVVHTLPSLAALRQHYPTAHITWVIEEDAAELILGHPHLDSALVSRRKTWIKQVKGGRIGEVAGEVKDFWRALRARPYDVAIDFHGLFKSAVITGLSGARRRLGYNSFQELSYLFYNERIPEVMTKHAVDRYLDFVTYLAGPVDGRDFTIPVTDENRRNVELLLEKEGNRTDGPLVAVNPVALWPTKLWSVEAFAELCGRMVREILCAVVLTGSRSDGPYLAAIAAASGVPVLNLAGRTSLKDLACLYRRADVVVSTASGPMHIAAAVGTPVVALFGPTDPARTGPYGQNHTVIRRDLECSPCFRKRCERNRCLGEITPATVLRAVEEKLREGKERRQGGDK
ncbi:MAG: lipopolysaccharide heptosyltransferase II [Syntrophales bacterium]|nr:lipopolysaccharide heptosyltransferase II [Syntrophales bacterium]